MRSSLVLALAVLVLAPVAAPGSAPAAPLPQSGLTIDGDLTGVLTPQDLADALLGTGVTITNVTYAGAPAAAGTFRNGVAVLGIDSGIVLSAGRVVDVVGPNSLDNTSTAFGTPGDPDLAQISNGFPTFDAAVLEFDFTSNFNTVVFRYVFTSEEYNEFANRSFNNVFGFFLDGTNLALLPDGITEVAINTVNGGNPSTCSDNIDNDNDGLFDVVDPDCNTAGDNIAGEDAQNPDFFINNDIHGSAQQAPAAAIDIEADGLTVVLEFIAEVTPGQTHTLKLGIADAGDAVLDSWVFIETASFSSAITQQVNLGVDVDATFDFEDASANFEFEQVNEAFELTVAQVPFDCGDPPRAGNFPGAVGIAFIPDPGGGSNLCVLYRIFNSPDEGQIAGLVESKIAWFDPAPTNPRLLRADDADSPFADITTGYFPQAEPGEDPGLRGGSRGLSDFMPIDWQIADVVVFDGFGSPLGGKKAIRTKAGRTIPAKFKLLDPGTGAPITGAATNITLTRVLPDLAGIEDITSPGNSFEGNQFIEVGPGEYQYNIKTKGLPVGEYVVTATSTPFLVAPRQVRFEIR